MISLLLLLTLVSGGVWAAFYASRQLSKRKRRERLAANRPLPEGLPERLRQHVAALVGTPGPRHFENEAALEQVADYIAGRLRSAGMIVQDQPFQAKGKTYRNVVGVYGDPAAKRKLVVGAHYDVYGEQDGADDNASAVAGMLEIARLLGQRQPTLNFAVEFVGFCLEEPPFFGTEQMGSYVHARSLQKAGTEVVTMICLEMIGYYDDAPGSQKYPYPALSAIYPDRGDFIALVGNLKNKPTVSLVKKRMKAATDLPVHSINAPESVPGLSNSDHRNYWALGFDALMVTDTAFYRNPHYHQKTDAIDTLDYERMGKAVVGLVAAIEG